MKIAILGAGPVGLQAAYFFYQLGASLTIFEQDAVGGELSKLADPCPKMKMQGTWKEVAVFDEIIKGFDLNNIPSIYEYYSFYLKLIANDLGPYIKKAEVLRVHKCFLDIDEEVEGKSRLQDLFRVVYSVDYEGSIGDGLEDRVADEELRNTILKSLKGPIENYEDFDLVMDASGALKSPNFMGPAKAPALNELLLKDKENIFYGFQSFLRLKEIKEKNKTIAIIGSGVISALLITELDEWVKKDGNELLVITVDEHPFMNLSAEMKNMVDKIIKLHTDSWRENCFRVESEIRKWRTLEDHMKAKIPVPLLPNCPLTIHKKTVVTSIDCLLDRKGIYLTCERSNFFSAKEHEDNLKTFKTDCVFVATGYALDVSLYKGMRTLFDFSQNKTKCDFGGHPEPGLFTLGAGSKNNNNFLLKDLEPQLKMIESEVMKYFKMVEA